MTRELLHFSSAGKRDGIKNGPNLVFRSFPQSRGFCRDFHRERSQSQSGGDGWLQQRGTHSQTHRTFHWWMELIRVSVCLHSEKQTWIETSHSQQSFSTNAFPGPIQQICTSLTTNRLIPAGPFLTSYILGSGVCKYQGLGLCPPGTPEGQVKLRTPPHGSKNSRKYWDCYGTSLTGVVPKIFINKKPFCCFYYFYRKRPHPSYCPTRIQSLLPCHQEAPYLWQGQKPNVNSHSDIDDWQPPSNSPGMLLRTLGLWRSPGSLCQGGVNTHLWTEWSPLKF